VCSGCLVGRRHPGADDGRGAAHGSDRGWAVRLLDGRGRRATPCRWPARCQRAPVRGADDGHGRHLADGGTGMGPRGRTGVGSGRTVVPPGDRRRGRISTGRGCGRRRYGFGGPVRRGTWRGPVRGTGWRPGRWVRVGSHRDSGGRRATGRRGPRQGRGHGRLRVVAVIRRVGVAVARTFPPNDRQRVGSRISECRVSDRRVCGRLRSVCGGRGHTGGRDASYGGGVGWADRCRARADGTLDGSARCRRAWWGRRQG